MLLHQLLRHSKMVQEDKANVAGVPSYSPKTMRDWALVVASVMSFLAGLSIVLRYLSRRIRKQPFWWDDYMIAFSMVRSIASCIQCTLGMLSAQIPTD